MADTNDEWDKEVAQTEEREEDQADAGRYEILSFPADTTLAGYRDQWENGQIYIPEFQRKFIWDQTRASKLVESFLLGLPVPGVFLYKERNGTKYWVIDGNQRINTVVSFLKGVFKEKKFSLKNVAPPWDGKSFEDLSEGDQFKLSTSVMRATIIQQLNPEDQSSIYYIFERLNTGGVNLNPMEVRMCIAEGTFTKLLRELNKVDAWRKLLQRSDEDSRTRDIELILRVFALRDKHSSYEKPMKKFLNQYINENRNPSQEWIAERRDAFLAAVENASRIKTGRPFHLKGKLNYAVLDSILIALMETHLTDPEELTQRYNRLVADGTFDRATSMSTSDRERVADRIRVASEIFA
jgi:uncharacterized protein with ParB-like and HNH nuclease domain